MIKTVQNSQYYRRQRPPMVTKINILRRDMYWALTLWQNFCIGIRINTYQALAKRISNKRTMYFLLSEVNVFQNIQQDSTRIQLDTQGKKQAKELTPVRYIIDIDDVYISINASFALVHFFKKIYIHCTSIIHLS